MMLLGILKKSDQGSALEFSGNVVERDAIIFEIWLVGFGFGMAGDTTEFVEMLSAFLSKREVGCV